LGSFQLTDSKNWRYIQKTCL